MPGNLVITCIPDKKERPNAPSIYLYFRKCPISRARLAVFHIMPNRMLPFMLPPDKEYMNPHPICISDNGE